MEKPNISFHTNDLLNCFHFFLMYFTFSVSRTTTLSMCHHLFQLKTISCVVAVLYYLGKMVSLFLRDEKWSINILHVCQNSENMIEFVRIIGIWFDHKRRKNVASDLFDHQNIPFMYLLFFQYHYELRNTISSIFLFLFIFAFI